VFRSQIEEIFNDVEYFIYDPTCDSYYADRNLNVYFEDLKPRPQDSYAISEAHLEIRKNLNYKFLEQVQKTQV
jgi:hypothetical protein